MAPIESLLECNVEKRYRNTHAYITVFPRPAGSNGIYWIVKSFSAMADVISSKTAVEEVFLDAIVGRISNYWDAGRFDLVRRLGAREIIVPRR
jgi:hypothetical protein